MGAAHSAAKRMNENEIGKIVVDAAIRVHKALGPGLLETVYEIASQATSWDISSILGKR